MSIPLLLKDGKFTKKTEQFGVQKLNDNEIIGYWQSPDDVVQWDFDAPQARAARNLVGNVS